MNERSLVEYFTGEKKGATDEKRHKTTQESPPGTESDLGSGRDIRDFVPFDQIGQIGIGRGDAGDRAHGGGGSVALGVETQGILFVLRGLYD